MTDTPPSPKRRRILSSMNPDAYTEREKSASPQPAAAKPASTARSPRADQRGDDTAEADPSEAALKSSKFRFKSKHSSRRHHRSSPHRDGSAQPDPSSSSSRRHHHHRHKRRRPRTPSPEDPSTVPDEPLEPEGRCLSPNTAFRESLFDAMADDEGAAYWEGVYGQPIHVYSRDRPSQSTDDPERGELEQMTDDEYATYVRRKMWEKTHAGLLEERARREEAKKRKEKEREEGRKIAEEMERSLKRGEERRRRRVWRSAWERYLDAWGSWKGGVEGIPWPTLGGKQEEVAIEGQVREFFEKGMGKDELGVKEFAARLKEERVRWHPDKVQQKLGGTVEGDVMKDVTAIFQVIDGLWNDTRSKA